MPPKGTRGGRTARGGRGRGTGRTVPITDDVAQPVSNDTPVAAEESQDNSIQNTPAIVPASLPTEESSAAPAIVPTRAPSLAPGRGRGRGRGAPLAGAAPPSFKPKNTQRRQDEERQRIAEEERKRIEERNKAAEVLGGRGSGRGRVSRAGRGRGDAMGRRNNVVGRASGLFSQLPRAEITTGNRIGQAPQETVIGSSGYDGYNGGDDYVSLPGRSKADHDARGDYRVGGVGGGGGGGGGVKIKREVPEPTYPGVAVKEGQRSRGVNIEDINRVNSDDDEDDMPSGKGKGRAKQTGGSGGLKPVRLPREEHRERITAVKIEAGEGPTANAADVAGDDDGGLFVPQDLEAERRRRNKAGVVSRDATGKPWAGVWSDSEDDVVHIKAEPGTEPAISEAMDIDSIPAAASPKAASQVEEPVIKEGPSPKPKTSLRRVPSWRGRYPGGLHTDEDKAEWERHKADASLLVEELGSLTAGKRGTNEAGDGDGDTEMGQDGNQKSDSGRMYLFQFPPKMPPLKNPDRIKKEEVTEEDVDMMQLPTRPAPGISGSSTAPIDMSKNANPSEPVLKSRDIKVEPGESSGVPKKADENLNDETIPEEGFIGKLVVRKSGKVELNWGGTSFQLGRGSEHEFLMNTLLIDTLDGDASGEDANVRSGVGSGLGPVMGMFVVTPDWDKML